MTVWSLPLLLGACGSENEFVAIVPVMIVNIRRFQEQEAVR